jgi:hypothetical protein
MPERTKPPADHGRERTSHAGADASPVGHRAAADGRLVERIRETIGAIARQMGARRRNLGRLDRRR